MPSKRVFAPPAISPAVHTLYITAGTAVVAIMMALWVLRWPDVHMPLAYDGDAIFVMTLIKTITTQTWPWHNTALGLPGDMALVDYPMVFVGQLACLKLLAILGCTPPTALNVYAICSFGACAAAAAWVLRQFALETSLCIAGALVYALLPYHFARIGYHLFLAAYCFVPICIYITLHLHAVALPKRRTLGWLVCSAFVVTLFNDTYYTFFFCYLVAASAILQAVGTRQVRSLLPALCILAANIGSALLALSPTLYRRLDSTTTLASIVRPANDTEHYGLKLIQMLLPSAQHTTEMLSRLTKRYNSTAPLINENSDATLGLGLGAVAIGLSMLWLSHLYRPSGQLAPASKQPQPPGATDVHRIQLLGQLTLLAFLFGTIGGLSAVVGYTLSPMIRSSNRIIVFIAFLLVLAAALWLSSHRRRMPKRQGRLPLAAYAFGFLALVVWDTHDIDFYPGASRSAEGWLEDAAFFQRVQASTAPNTRIFQLPVVVFPEGGFQRLDYDQLKPYLHTQERCFSFGSMQQTPGHTWNLDTAHLIDAEDTVAVDKRLGEKGFDSVLLNTAFAGMNGDDIRAKLAKLFGAPALTSPSGHFVFYKLPRAPSAAKTPG